MAIKPQRPIPAATFSRNFGLYKDQAFANGIVEVSSNGHPIGAFLSQEEYEKFRAFKRRSTQDGSVQTLED